MTKMLLTQEDCENLIGKVCRFEWGGVAQRVGLVTGIRQTSPLTTVIQWTDADGNYDDVGVTGLTWVVFATVATPDSVRSHEVCPRLYWRDRMAPEYAHYR